MIVDKINSFLSNVIPGDVPPIDALIDEYSEEMVRCLKRQCFERRESKNTLRLSSIGKCLRGQMYTKLGYKTKPISPELKMKFLHGDMIEALIVVLAKHAGAKLTDEQKEVKFGGVTGHVDGIYEHINVVKKGTPEHRYVDGKYLFECKSMSDASFKRFKSKGMDNGFGYVSQANSYAYGLKLKGILWVCMNKNTGAIHEEVRDIDYGLVAKTEDDIVRLRASTDAEEFDRYAPEEETWGRCTKKNPDNRTGNMVLPFNCGYCSQNENCFDVEVTQILRKGRIKNYIGPVCECDATSEGIVI